MPQDLLQSWHRLAAEASGCVLLLDALALCSPVVAVLLASGLRPYSETLACNI